MVLCGSLVPLTYLVPLQVCQPPLSHCRPFRRSHDRSRSGSLQAEGKFCTGTISPQRVSGGGFATLVSSNCLMHTLTCKSMLHSERHDTRAVPRAGRASGRRRHRAAPGLCCGGAPYSQAAGPNKAMGVWTPPTFPRLPWAGRPAGSRACPPALADALKFHQEKISPPSLKTKISQKLSPHKVPPPPPLW